MNKALLIIDPQKIYTDKESDYFCEKSNVTIKNINKLIDTFRKNGDLLIYIRHVHKIDGSDIGRMYDFTGEDEDFEFKGGDPLTEYDESLLKPNNDIEIIKTRYSAFKNTDLHNILKQNQINRVVICGFMTNFCCENTAREAHDLDYFVDFIIDATGTPGLESYDQDSVRKYITESLEAGFAVVNSTKEYLG